MTRTRTQVDLPIDHRQSSELKKGRSRVTNGTRLFLAAAGIDYRSTRARRFKDLVEAYQQEFEVATESDMNLVRDAASMTLKAEEMQAAQVRGENVASDEIVRMSGQLRRVLVLLKRRSNTDAPAAPSVTEHWAANHEDEGAA